MLRDISIPNQCGEIMTITKGIYRPSDTGYQIYEATFSDGSTYISGAMNEAEFRTQAERFGYDIEKVKALEAKDIGDGYKEVIV